MTIIGPTLYLGLRLVLSPLLLCCLFFFFFCREGRRHETWWTARSSVRKFTKKNL